MDIPVLSQVIAALNRIGKNTDAAGTNTLFAYEARGAIKSIQRGSVTTGNNTVTISAVNTSKAFATLNTSIDSNATGSSGGSFYGSASAYLASSTTVQVNTSNSGYGTVYWQVIEFY